MLLALLHALVAHGLVDAGVGSHLGAVQRHMPHLHQAGLLAEPEHLHKQILQQLQVPAAELTDPCVVRLLVTAQYPERQILVAGPLDLS